MGGGGGREKLLSYNSLRLESKSPAVKSLKMKNPQECTLAGQEDSGLVTLLLDQ